MIYGSHWCGQNAITDLDGIEGLKYIAETRGKALAEHSDHCGDRFTVDQFQEKNPKIKVYQELTKAAKDNQFIKKFLNAIKENTNLKDQNSKRPKFNYRIVKENIESKKVIPVFPAGIRELTKTDLKKLAADFLQETAPDKQVKYLRIFNTAKFPYDHQHILQIAKGKDSQNNRLVEYACNALRHFEGPDIRQFAIRKLSSTGNPTGYLYLLVANYQKGDHELLTKIVTRYKNEDVIHSLVWGYIDIFQAEQDSGM
ncbi:MAG: hypothetical protein JKY52_17080 [Flavobacteriales bacterium]|nr:hypothetical protein [Flavobacteriales bacterium]